MARFLAEHVLSGGDEALHHLAMQKVGHDHADDVDVGVLRYRLPGGVIALVSEAPSCQRAKLRTDIADGDEPQVRQCGLIKGWCHSVRRRMRPARHARSDYCNANRHGPLLE
jgi:hypothetical protein